MVGGCIMNNETGEELRSNAEENKNAYNDIRIFFKLLLFSELYMLFISGRQIFFESRDCSPAVAGINTALLILTIYHIRKIKTVKK